MSVRTDVINLNVNINGDKAKDQLNQLRKRSAELSAEMKGLKKNTDEYRAKASELQQVQARMASLRSQIGLTALSQKELVAELKRLQALKNFATPQTREFRELQVQIDAVSRRLHNVRTGMFGFKSFLGSIRAEVKQFGMLAAGYLGFGFITSQTQNLIRSAAKYSDSLSDMRKATGLSNEEVKKMAKSLKEIDTRTTNSDLRELAIAAGKLGKTSAEDIMGFVRAADKLKVALGDDLQGSAEDIAKTVGKISQVFHVEDMYGTEQGLLKIGSAINQLAQSGTADADYLVEFTRRMGGIAPLAGITVDKILALGTTLDELGQTSEVSSTSLSKLFLKMSASATTFSKYAGMSIKDFKHLVDTDMMSAFIAVLKGVKGNANGMNELATTLGDLGLDGGRVVGVLGSLANNTDRLTELMGESNKAFLEGTSITNEFDLKNQNFAATVAKLGKAFDRLFTSSTFNAAIQGLVNGFVKLVDWLPKVFDWFKQNAVALGAWVAGVWIATGGVQALFAKLITLATGIKMANAQITISTFLTRALVAAQLTWGIITAALTLNVRKLREAWLAFNLVLKVNPLTALLIVIGSIVAAISIFSAKTMQLTGAMRGQIELAGRVATATAAQEVRVRNLVTAINSQNTTLEQKKKFLKDLIALDPTFLKGLTLANFHTKEGTAILQGYIDKLKEKAKAEALSNYQVEIEKQRIDLMSERIKKQKEWTNLYKDGGVAAQTVDAAKIFIPGVKSLAQEIGALDDKLRDLNETQKYVEGEVQKGIQKGTIKTDDDANSTGVTVTPTDKKMNAKLRAMERIKDEIIQLNAHVREMEAKGLDDQEAVNEAEVKQVQEKYAKLISEALKYAMDIGEINKLERRELAATFKNQFKDRSDREYKKSLENLEKYYKQQRDLASQNFADGLINEREYNLDIRDLDIQEIESKTTLANDYKDTVKQAAKDIETLKTDTLKEGIETRKIIEERSIADRKAMADRMVIIAPDGSKAQLEAKAAQLELEYQLAIESKAYTDEELATMEADKNARIEEMTKQHWLSIAQYVMQGLSMIGNAINDMVNARNDAENQELENERARNDEKQKMLDRRLKAGQISQEQHDRAIDSMNQKMDKKEKELRLKQAKRNKAAALFGAIINTAGAVAQALNNPWPINLIFAALAGVLGGIQIANIASAPLPTGRKGLVVQGPSHEASGITMVDNQTNKPIAEIEGGEPVMVLSKNTYGNNRDLIDELLYNSNYRNGARVAPAWTGSGQPRINMERALPAMRAGGVVANSADTVSAINTKGQDMGLWLRQIALSIDTMREENKEQKKQIEAVVSLQDFDRKRELYDRAKRLGGIN